MDRKQEIKKINSYFTKAHSGKADSGLAHRACATLFENVLGLFFVNFDCITRIYFNCSEHAMFTIRILFTTLIIKTFVYVKGHQNNPHTPRILPRRDYAPGLEISGSATVLDLKAIKRKLKDSDPVNSKNA